MKITKELIKQHGLGLSTEKERKAIEEWFERLDDPTSGPKASIDRDENRKQIWFKISQAIPELGRYSSKESDTNVIPLHRRVIRYAAAACILLLTFFGGRFSANTANASTVVDKTPKDMLYIYGGNRAEACLPGQEYKIKFDGQIKLFNDSFMEKKIHVGGKAFTLSSYSTYYLSGSAKSPTLLSGQTTHDNPFENGLKGDFLIVRTDKL
ncbi:MAG: hypothetical protein AAGI25_21290 [Bacteroidota bacterium]